MEGKVKFFNDEKGYGFIIAADGKEYFVHYKGISSNDKRKTLVKDQTVEFEIVESEKGLQATNVVVK